MKTKIKYSEGPIDIADLKDLVRVPDFLPSPDEIARRMDKTKITITLSADSVEFFKKKAREHDLQYQLLIRHILDEYVAHQMQNEKENEKTKSGKAH
jgi:predicted DNA binding CopG/RHH family protein